MELLILACGMLMVLGLVGAVVVITVTMARRDGRTWAQNAQQLGLTLGAARRRTVFGGSGPSIHQPMHGHRADLPVEIGIRVVVRRSANNRSRTEYFTYAKVTFPRPLDIGLRASAKGWVGRTFDAVAGQSDLQVGDPELDAAFDIRAADAQHAVALLQTPYVRDGMVWLAKSAFPPQVTDTQVYCERRGKQLDLGAQSLALDGAVDLARRVLAARAQLGLSTNQQVVAERWRPVAERHGLALDVEGSLLSGRLEGVHVEVDAQLRGQARLTVFTVRFDRPLGVGLRMTKQSGLHSLGKLFGMQDIEVGEPAFDNRFVIKGNPPARVRQMLTPEVRARLADLSDRAAKLEVHDDRLVAEVGWLIVEGADVESGLFTVARAAAALAGVSSAEAGPFR